MKEEHRQKIREANKRRVKERAAVRQSEVFRHDKWYVYRFDDLNYCLAADDDGAETTRYYPSLAEALRGMAKRVQPKSLTDAMREWNKLEAQIATLDA